MPYEDDEELVIHKINRDRGLKRKIIRAIEGNQYQNVERIVKDILSAAGRLAGRSRTYIAHLANMVIAYVRGISDSW